MLRVIGLDPGLRFTGWGIIELDGQLLRFIDAGCVESNPKDDLAVRLEQLHSALKKITKNFKPDEAAIEETFVNQNPASALKLGQARGVVLLVPALFSIPVSEYAATTVKKSVTGSGHADKVKVRSMVNLLLRGVGQLKFDASDALAVAICHSHFSKSNSKLSAISENLKVAG